MIVHVLILWYFMTQIVARDDRPEIDGARGELSLFDLGGASREITEHAKKSVETEKPQAAVPSPVETTAANNLPPPEWTVVRVRTKPETATPTAPPPERAPRDRNGKEAAMPGRAGGQGGNGASGPAGDGTYDPFAGAAPLWRESPQGRGAGGSSDPASNTESGMALDRETLKALLRIAGPRFKWFARPYEFIVQVSASGTVLEMRLSKGQAGQREAAFRQAAMGRRLYHPLTGSDRVQRGVLQVHL